MNNLYWFTLDKNRYSRIPAIIKFQNIRKKIIDFGNSKNGLLEYKKKGFGEFTKPTENFR
jgi:hypothetical protein